MIIYEMKDISKCVENWVELRKVAKEALLESQKRSCVPW
jgi:hypothetical protein